jgi:hypothetical protein
MILGTLSSDPSGRTTSKNYLNYFGVKRALRSVALSIHFAQIPAVFLIHNFCRSCMQELAQKRELWRHRGRRRPMAMGMLVVSESDQNYKYNKLYFSLEDILGSEYFFL